MRTGEAFIMNKDGRWNAVAVQSLRIEGSWNGSKRAVWADHIPSEMTVKGFDTASQTLPLISDFVDYRCVETTANGLKGVWIGTN